MLKLTLEQEGMAILDARRKATELYERIYLAERRSLNSKNLINIMIPKEIFIEIYTRGFLKGVLFK